VSITSAIHKVPECGAQLTHSAHRLDSKTSTFSIEAEFSNPTQTLSAYVGVNELAGLQSVTLFDPKLPSNFFPKVDRDIGQVKHRQSTGLMTGRR